MCGLNVTHQALATPAVVSRMRAVGTPLARACVELVTFFASTYERVFGLPDPPLHDPVALALLIDPSLVECVEVPVSVELTGTHTRGATVVDLHRRTGAAPNARVALRLRTEAFWDLVIGAIERSGSPAAGSPS
jgi:purine nucleosidase/pyrimidine-specific ribonucleoside hydrolase